MFWSSQTTRLASWRFVPACRNCIAQSRSVSSSQNHDPLRVLFCGADQFSIHSLRALNDVKLKYPEKVASIDVVCRPDKRVGRGLKRFQEVPIKNVARRELDLPIHQIDTFTGWSPPKPSGESINLVVAVSFGLLVPPRILNAAKYGGLNVHPSMLPDMRGPAPLHRTLLDRLDKTGVTLQTLHPKHFDQGRIVDQTPDPGLSIPDLATATVDSLISFLGPLGADMLAKNILDGSFARTEAALPLATAPRDGVEQRHASKIGPADREIDWAQWRASDLLIRDRVLGRTWSDSLVLRTLTKDTKAETRFTFHGWKDYTKPFQRLQIKGGEVLTTAPSPTENFFGVPMFVSNDTEKKRVLFWVRGDGPHDIRVVCPTEITVEGKAKTPASKFWEYCVSGEKARLVEPEELRRFHERKRQ